MTECGLLSVFLAGAWAAVLVMLVSLGAAYLLPSNRKAHSSPDTRFGPNRET
jgi:hypothetical protein